ncbi:hypothetical protein GCM10007874_07150 [Labrys miyagiensis]|uniref:DUF4112 domain-containing protein n=1 Tax=Labrys miyagiensis TaxID=346912 RepID=A0ABQ6CCN1_9HYPH|nr:DUF4112 domain-containing protein [Labrys miyagiensis]GLS17700.1 hypothetical protein GCM10007874_07150 [Labrys miyagiensis]
MAFASSRTFDDRTDLRARVERLDRLSRLLDTAFAIPFTKIRFGVDAIIGLIPGFGDWAGVLLSSIIVIEAMRIGVPRVLLARMVVNVAIEGALGVLPVAGDIVDIFWRANRQNMALLRDHLLAEGRI